MAQHLFVFYAKIYKKQNCACRRYKYKTWVYDCSRIVAEERFKVILMYFLLLFCLFQKYVSRSISVGPRLSILPSLSVQTTILRKIVIEYIRQSERCFGSPIKWDIFQIDPQEYKCSHHLSLVFCCFLLACSKEVLSILFLAKDLLIYCPIYWL